MKTVHRFEMRGTPRTAAGGNLYGGCAYLAADMQLEKTQFAPRGGEFIPPD